MIIPSTPQAKERKLKDIADQCLHSQTDRYNAYMFRRNYFLFGANEQSIGPRVLYNRLQAHTDLVASFLFAADHADFEVAAPHNSSKEIVEQCLAITEDWNDEFRDSGLAYQIAEAILWALIYDSMFIKVGWNEGRDCLTSVLVPPYNFGVYDENESDLGNQHAFLHTFTIDYDEAAQRLIRAGMRDRLPDLRSAETEDTPTLPQPLQLMLASTQVSTIMGPYTGSIYGTLDRAYGYRSKQDSTRVRFNELWVWDDEAEQEKGELPTGDYRRFLLMEPNIVLEDSKETIAIRKRAGLRGHRHRLHEDSLSWTNTNDYIPGEHPFTHIKPFSIYDYFFGEAHSERLIPLQDWTTLRLREIHEILDMQVDPPRVFSGFTSLPDEKAEALHGPGSWVTDFNPGAKVDRMVPEMPEDLFAEVKAIGQLFLEASGLTETVTGQGGENVRSGQQARHAATTGSSRIRKTAVGLEPQLVQLGDTVLKLRQQKDARILVTNSQMRFTLSQLATHRWKMRIAAHSHSPLFADQSRVDAQILIKAQAIDRENFLRMMKPPGETNLVHSLRERVKAEQQMAAQNPALLQGPGSTKGKR